MNDEHTNGDHSFQEYLDKVDIQEVLLDAGYVLNRRDGLRYPSYVRLDDQGRRISGSKFLVTANRLCCFQPPSTQKYNVISFITAHPDLFKEYHAGMNPYSLVHLVCRRLLNEPVEQRQSNIIQGNIHSEPFDITKYKLTHLEKDNLESQKKFFPYFRDRGLSLATQNAFSHAFFLTEHTNANGFTRSNLSFPMYKPTDQTAIVGLEQRGLPYKDGKPFKGMARNTNASEGMWIASPFKTELSDAQRVFVFESAYDAMAFYQILTGRNSSLTWDEKNEIKSSVFISTGGNPSVGQMIGMMKAAPNAIFHLAFDNDLAGKQFCMNFQNLADRLTTIDKEYTTTPKIVREEPDPAYKDFNDQLLGKKMTADKEIPIENNHEAHQDDATIQSTIPRHTFHR